jgi:DNA-binding YbaB/EbfC family protein
MWSSEIFITPYVPEPAPPVIEKALAKFMAARLRPLRLRCPVDSHFDSRRLGRPGFGGLRPGHQKPQPADHRNRDLRTKQSQNSMSSIGKLMKQAARMQQQMEQIQAELARRTVETSAGGGAVKVTAKCDGTLAAIKVDPQALNPDDALLLEDMLLSAVNQALAQAKAISNAEMQKVTAGFSLPGFG